jgi:hypothetical protein
MESGEAVAVPQTPRLGQFWHARNMPRTRDCQVNENPFKIGVNSRNFARFYPLDREKIEFSLRRVRQIDSGACYAAL